MLRAIGNPLQNCDNGRLIQYDTVNTSLAPFGFISCTELYD
ncbi:MAG: hypothetical protein ACI9BO_002670 [Zhongshania sp.]|jgi:hypothetical protein